MKQNGYLPIWLLTPNGLKDCTPYFVCPVGNSPEFMSIDNSLNREILPSFCMHIVLSRYILDGEETDEEERNMCFSYSAPRKISRGLKRIFDSQMGVTPSSASIIKDVDLALKALEIFYCASGTVVEGISDRNGHIRNKVGEWGKCQLGRFTNQR